MSKLSQETQRMHEALVAMIAAFDTPIVRRKVGNEYTQSAIDEAKDAALEYETARKEVQP